MSKNNPETDKRNNFLPKTLYGLDLIIELNIAISWWCQCKYVVESREEEIHEK